MDPVAEVLLRRRRRVAAGVIAAEPFSAETTGGRPHRGAVLKPAVGSGVVALEAELLQAGFLLSAELHQWLAGTDATELSRVGHHLVRAILAELGADVQHVPLFRDFPRSVPTDTAEFYVRRVFTLLLQESERPCVLCGTAGTVHPVAPCAHLVCRTCWDGAVFSACPICHRRVDPDDPFLRPADDPVAEATTARAPRTQLTVLGLCEDAEAASRDLLEGLLARQTPLSAEDRADVMTLVERNRPASGGWLPETIPLRETRATVLAALIADGDADDLLARHTDTATDVLRLLYALMGGDPGLRTPPPRRTTLPRGLRRALLGRLDAMPMARLTEDVLRYTGPWTRMAEVLHPHEHHLRFPGAALAFAVLRGTRLDAETPFGRAMLSQAARHPGVLRVDGRRLRTVTFAAQVENALRDGDLATALALLARRPGELLRRLSHLLRLVQPSGSTRASEQGALAPGVPVRDVVGAGSLLAVLEEAVRKVAPGVVVATLGQVRTPSGGTRLFQPRGGALFWAQPDSRPELPARLVGDVADVLTREMLRRAGTLPPLDRVVLDEGLTDLIAPASERSATSALVRIARGGLQPIPRGERIRLFLHWTEPEGTRVDLDLSVAVYDERWEFVGLCDYTSLRIGGDAAVHSGDLTSAPGPLGSSEFVDLDVRALRELGGRYVMPVVFSFDDVPFDQLVRGFAGFMESPAGLFDPLAVRQRFDLAGPAKTLVPLVADLWSRTMRWADLNLSTRGRGHDVDGYAAQLARLGSALEDFYGLGERVTLWEVACWHAAARAGEVLVRRGDGAPLRYARRAGEDAWAFASRLMAARDPDGTVDGPVGAASLAAVIDGDVALAPGAEVYALYPDRLEGTGLRLLDAADLLSGLAVEPEEVGGGEVLSSAGSTAGAVEVQKR
ncbi:MXAN_6230/SCO0854 family RING domain-containing protein [Sphaerisporangium corydalis]|uniref:MXAN_6230/SCO0854 family RING domain-containing protein n=1 Tax=Sphaerisporangium corydalis TaxID=1441875 RepID=A0ABV9EBJ5_9ACTN|nr:MXAN_6230/SCO0854 family RING domain-containing protein [Sphaerisporangium corydalis]